MTSTPPIVFTVNTVSDTVDVKVGDGLAEDAAGNTSLRAAIQEANAAASGSFEIVLGNATYTLTRTGVGEDGAVDGDLDVFNSKIDIAIEGASVAGTVIDGGGLDRVFDLLGGGRLQLENLTIQNGSSTSTPGGGIRSAGFLDIQNARLTGNTGVDGGAIGIVGGGATLTDVKIDNNNATNGGGLFANGGTTTIVRGSIELNSASTSGGGILNTGGSQLSILHGRVDTNIAVSKGGGISNTTTGSGSLFIDGSSVSEDTVSGTGGEGGGIHNTGTLTVNRSTLASNSMTNGNGGGLFNSGSASVTNSTIGLNNGGSVQIGGGIYQTTGGASLNLLGTTIYENQQGVFLNGGAATVQNTVIAGNGDSAVGIDVDGNFTSFGNNFISVGNGSTGFTNGVNGDQVGTDTSPLDPILEPLDFYGGPTQTYRPLRNDPVLPDSPLINAGQTIFAFSNGLVASIDTDQRGVPRSLESFPDIGAFETGFTGFIVNTFTDTPDANLGDGVAADASGNVSLRAAVMQANFNGGADIVVGPGIYTLTRTGTESSPGEFDDLDITGNSRLIGAGLLSTVIDANGIGRGIENTGTLTITGLSVINGNVGTEDGGGLLNVGTLQLLDVRLDDNQAANGGGLATLGQVTGERVSMHFNRAVGTGSSGLGGGLYVVGSGNKSVFANSFFVDNSAGTEGGGIANNGDLELRNPTVQGNSANGSGGGIANETKLFVSGGNISFNSAVLDAGGIGHEGPELILESVTVSDNTAGRDAGGIGSVGKGTIIGGTISKNIAGRDGGGIGVTSGFSASDLNVIGTQILDNTASGFGGGVAVSLSTGMSTGPTPNVRIEFTEIEGNLANAGAGVSNNGANLAISRSAIVVNTSSGPTGGGGLLVQGQGSNLVSDTTISNNTSASGGGGVMVTSANLTLTNATVVENSATAGFGGGLNVATGGTVFVANSIIADNTSGAATGAADLANSGTLRTRGGNFIGIGIAPFANGVLSDQVGTVSNPRDPQLGALQFNGGKTKTHAPQAGSTVIDGGAIALVADPTRTNDQRGVPRFIGSAVDIGAFESGFAGFFVTTTNDTADANPGDGVAQDESGQTSLRAAIQEANALGGTQTIILPTGRYQLSREGSNENLGSTGDLDVSDNLAIIGYGSAATVIDGISKDRVFDVVGNSSLTLTDLRLEQGKVAGESGGAIRVVDGSLSGNRIEILSSQSNSSTDFGGAISATKSGSSPVISLSNSRIENTSAPAGGAIYVSNGTLNLDNVEISKSQATLGDGGAISLSDSNGTLNKVLISESKATVTGGALFHDQTGATVYTVEITNSTFGLNTANEGGAIAVDGGKLLLTNSRLLQNMANSGGGGGLLNEDGVVSVTGSLIRSNSALGGSITFGGGGLANFGSGQLDVIESTIELNNTSQEGGGIVNFGTLTVIRSTLSENSASNGGGLSLSGTETITSSTIAKNNATAFGGGLYSNAGAANVLNSTFTGNSATTGGGGLLSSTTVTLTNTLVALNDANGTDVDVAGTFTSGGNNLISELGTASGFVNGTNGDIVAGTTITTISNATNATPIRVTSTAHGLATGDAVRITGVEGNTAANGVFQIVVINANEFELLDLTLGTAVAGNGNYASGGTVRRIIDPKIGPLQNNTVFPTLGVVGGDALPGIELPTGPVVTKTVALRFGSPAIDAGTNSGAPSTDQRGFFIPIDGDNNGTATADIGAYEVFHTTVSGNRYHDLNANETRDPGEPGLPNRTVYLDVNTNGRYDAGEPFTTTLFDDPGTAGIDETGNYVLTFVPPGSNVIDVLVQTQSGIPQERRTEPYSTLLGSDVVFGNSSGPAAFAVADLDGDFQSDLAVVNTNSNSVSIYLRREGVLTFTQTVTVGTSPKSIAAGDLNKDGLTDLVVANFGSDNVSVLMNQSGSFGPVASFATGSNPSSLALGALDANGNLDIAVANSGSNNITVLSGNGAGGFSKLDDYTTGTNPRAIVAVDFENDGIIDLATADRDANTISILRNSGSGVFTSRQVINVAGTLPSSLIADDFDRDGDFDLAFGAVNTGEVKVVINVGFGDFDVISAGSVANPAALASADINGDRKIDLLAVSDSAAGSLVIFTNGTGSAIDDSLTFDSSRTFPVGANPTALAIIDIDQDGRPDILTGENGTSNLNLRLNISGSTLVTTVTGVATTNVIVGTQSFGEVRGKLFNDLNNNGVQDPSEPGLGGLSLFLDQNGNGRQDPYEPVAGSQQDDPGTIGINETGDYTFAQVVPGPYRVYYYPNANSKVTTPATLAFDAQHIRSGQNSKDSQSIDVNGDGNFDLVVVTDDNYSAAHLAVLFGDGRGRFAEVQDLTLGTSASVVRAADLDNDGDLDLLIPDTSANQVSVFENVYGVFSQKLQLTGFNVPTDLEVADIDGDGFIDFAVGQAPSVDDYGVAVVRNTGGFNFSAPTLRYSNDRVTSIEFSDVDRDGDQDLVYLEFFPSRRIGIEINDGKGNFSFGVGIATPADSDGGRQALALGDLNGDAFPDIAFAASNNKIYGLLNNGDVTFGSSFEIASVDATAIRFRDLDTDQRVSVGPKTDDLVVGTSNGAVQIYQATSPGVFGPPSVIGLGGQLQGLSFADFDEDGRTDVAVMREFSFSSEFVLFNRLGNPEVIAQAGTFVNAPSVGLVELASVQGTVYRDVNGNGVREPDEGPLSGVTAFVDYNGDGKLNGSEPFAVTNANGGYLIEQVQPRIGGQLRIISPNDRMTTGPVGETFQFASTALGANYPIRARDTVKFDDLNLDTVPEVIAIAPNATASDIRIYQPGDLTQTKILPLPAIPSAFATGQVNGDSYRDLVVATLDGQLTYFRNSAETGFDTGTTLPVTISDVTALSIGDIDGDGLADVLVATSSSIGVRKLLQTAGGNFVDDGQVTLNGTTGYDDLEVSDFDNNGLLDIAVIDRTKNSFLYAQQISPRSFTVGEVAIGTEPISLAITDVDNDGDIDAIVANKGSKNLQLLEHDAGSFSLGTDFTLASEPGAISIAKTGANTTRVFVTQPTTNAIQRVVLETSSTPTFTAGATLNVRGFADALDVGDINQDGRLDVAVALNGQGSIAFLTDTTGDTNGAYFVSPLAGQDLIGGFAFGSQGLPGSVTGITFDDYNANGTQDVGEPGIGGVRVYFDQNLNRLFDVGEASVLTNPDGTYLLNNIPSEASASISQEVPAAAMQTAPISANFVTHTMPVGIGLNAIVSGDFTGDGLIDLVASNASGSGLLLFTRLPGLGYAAPVMIPTTPPVSLLSTADVNADGKLDLLALSGTTNEVLVLMGLGGGSFAAPVSYAVGAGPVDLAVADLTGDGKLDLLTINQVGDSYTLLTNDGAGGFSKVTTSIGAGTQPSAVAVGDFDGDTDIDLAMTLKSANEVRVFANDGPGNFSPTTSLTGLLTPVSVVTADFNGDTQLDLAVSQAGTDDIEIYFGNGDAFSGVTSKTVETDGTGTQLLVGEFTGDALPDLVTISRSDGQVRLFRSSAAGTFTLSASANTLPNLATGTTALVNADGDLDLVVTNGALTPSIQFLVNNRLSHSVTLTPSQTLSGIDFGNQLPNDAPVIAAPTTVTTSEDTAFTFSSGSNPITVSDADAPTQALEVTLTASNGLLSLGTTANLVFSVGSGSLNATMTFTGTLSAINAALDGLQFVPDFNFNGSTTLQVDVSDLGNSGSGGAMTDSKTVTVNVGAVNDAPFVVVPGSQTTNEDTAFVFSSSNGNLITVNDIDGTNGAVTLAVTNGTLSLSGTTGLTFTTGDGTTDATMTFTGAIADINSALDGLTFVPALNFNGSSSLSVSFDDQGNTGAGGALSATQSVSINVTAVNDAPTVDVPGAQAATEDGSLVFNSSNSNLITIADLDGTAGEVTLAVTNGTLSLSGTTGLTFSTGDGTADATMTFTGTIADINAALDGLLFAPNANFNGAASLSVAFNDQGNTGTGGAASDSQSVTINVGAVNDAPSVNVPGTQSATEDTALVFNNSNSNRITVTDIDGTAGEVTLAVTNGTLSLSGTTGLTFSTGDGTADATMTFTGSIADINAALDGLSFLPSLNFNGATSLSVSFNDQGNTGTGGALSATQSVTINVGAVNDAPVVNVPGTQTATEDASFVFNNSNSNRITVADLDGTAGEVTLAVTNGTLSLSGTTGLTFSTGDGTADATMTFTGTIADINAALDGLLFAPNANFNGAADLSVAFNDQGNIGAGGAASDSKSVTINVGAVNDAPVVFVPTRQTISEDGTLTFSINNSNPIVVNDLDATNGELTLSVTNGTLTLSGTSGLSFSTGDGTADATMTFSGTIAAINAALEGLVFTPSPNFNGAPDLSVSFSDLGESGSGGALTDSGVVSITVLSVNDAPVGADNIISVLEDSTYTFALNDFGFGDPADSPSNQLASVKITTLPATGSLTLNGTAVTAGAFINAADISSGLLQFAPAANATGPATLSFQLQDDGGTANGGTDLSATANSITFNVTGINDAPSGTDNTVTGTEDTAFVFAASDFGFSDARDLPANSLQAVKITTVPATGELRAGATLLSAGNTVNAADINGGKLRYIPAADAFGSNSASFTFQVIDGGGTANGGVNIDGTPNVLTIDLNAVNDGPTFDPQTTTFSLPENSANGTSIATVTASDIDSAGSLSFSIVGGNTNGAFAINATSGEITVAKSNALDFESTPSFALEVRVQDNSAVAPTPLGAKLTLNINLTDGAEPFVIPASAFAAAIGNVTLVLDGTTLRAVDATGTNVVPPVDASFVTAIQAIGRDAADDVLSIDFTNGDPVVANLLFNGGTSTGDTVRLLNGSSAQILHRFTNASQGAIDFGGPHQINLQDVERRSDLLTSSQRAFQADSPLGQVILRDDAVSNDAINAFVDADGTPIVRFAQTSGSINFIGSTDDDDLRLEELDAQSDVTLSVFGGAGNDRLTVETSLVDGIDLQLVTGFDGQILHGRPAGTKLFNFQGVENVFDVTESKFGLVAFTLGNDLVVVGDSLSGDAITEFYVSSGATLGMRMPTVLLTVFGFDGDDSLSLQSLDRGLDYVTNEIVFSGGAGIDAFASNVNVPVNTFLEQLTIDTDVVQVSGAIAASTGITIHGDVQLTGPMLVDAPNVMTNGKFDGVGFPLTVIGQNVTTGASKLAAGSSFSGTAQFLNGGSVTGATFGGASIFDGPTLFAGDNQFAGDVSLVGPAVITGTLNVNSGTLSISGQTTLQGGAINSKSPVLVSSSDAQAGLLGRGTVTAPSLTLGANAVLDPQLLLAVPSTSLDPQATYHVDLQGGKFDVLNVNGTFNPNGATLAVNSTRTTPLTMPTIIVNNDGTDAIGGSIFGQAIVSSGGADRGSLSRLTTGDGDATLDIDVDPTGQTLTDIGIGGLFDPVGPSASDEATFDSTVMISTGTTRQRLTTAATNVSTITGSDSTALSTFRIGDLVFTLHQTVTPTFNRLGRQSGTLLTQTYEIQNVGNGSQDFELVRYYDAFFDSSRGAGIVGGGRYVTPDGTELLYISDRSAGMQTQQSVAVSGLGGTIPTSERFQITEFPSLRQALLAGATLDDSIFGDSNEDGAIDIGSEYIATVALRNLFNIAAGGSDTYTTHTLFGTGLPEENLETMTGRFAGLPEGTAIDLPIVDGQGAVVGMDRAAITYFGGDGNDIALRPIGGIAGRVFDDINEDGLFDRDDVLRQNVSVSLLDANTNTVIDSQLTDANGKYLFGDLPAGKYRVAFESPNGFLFTDRDVGTDDTVDSDANPLTGLVPIIPLQSGEHLSGFDAGLIPARLSISDGNPLPEGQTGTVTPHEFTVSLNGISTRPVSVVVTAAEGHGGLNFDLATQEVDFVPLPNGAISITLQPGQTEKVVRVLVTGDNDIENDEAFVVILSSPTSAMIADDTGLGVITNDDVATPTVQIRPNTSTLEGNPPERNRLDFTVELLGGAITQDVVVSYETIDAPLGGKLPPDAAIPGKDYVSTTGTVTIRAGETSADFSVGVIADRLDEANESVRVRITGVTNATTASNLTATGIIIDDDNAMPTISIGDASVIELDAPSLPVLSFPILLDAPAPDDIVVTYSTLALDGIGYATPDVDFESVTSGTVTISRGQQFGFIRIVVTADQEIEVDESLAIELESVTGPGVLGDRLGIGTIQNDDVTTPVVSIRAGDPQPEGRSGRIRQMPFIISLTGTSDTDVTLTVSTVDLTGPGTATSGTLSTANADYIAFTNRRVTIPAGSVEVVVNVDIIGDENIEPDEMVRLQIDDGSVSANATIDPFLTQASATIVNDDTARPVLTLRDSSTTETDAPINTVVTFTAKLDSVPTSTVTATYRTVSSVDVPNPATAGVDFIAVSAGTITFAPGQTEATFSITVLGDDEVEAPEDLFVEITTISGNADLDPFRSLARGTIFDDDGGRPQVSIRSLGDVTESDAPERVPAQFLIELDRPADTDIAVQVATLPPPIAVGPNGLQVRSGQATPDVDFRRVDANDSPRRDIVIIRAGQTSATYGVPVIGDDLVEPDERFTLGIVDVSPNADIDPEGRQAEVVILNDDVNRPTLSISNAFGFEGDPEGGIDQLGYGELIFTVDLSGPVGNGTVTVELETVTGNGAGLASQDPNDPNRDFFQTRRILTFDPNVTSQEFRVRIIPDDHFEGPELFFVRLVSATGATLPVDTLQGVGTIANDDAPEPTISVDSVRVLEGNSNGENSLEFTISLDADPEANQPASSISVDFATKNVNAIAGTDYTAQSGTLTFATGERTKTVRVPIIGNKLADPTRELLLELSNPTNAVLDPAATQGIGTIDDDDGSDVELRIDSVSQREGDSGSTIFDFTVTKIGRSPSNVTVDFATQGGTATSGTDFRARTGTLTFTPDGPSEQMISVTVFGDRTVESEIEDFFITLSNAQGATINPLFEQGVGAIFDDDERVFREDGDAELMRLAGLIQDAITRLGNDPGNQELLTLITNLSRQVLTRVGLTSGLVYITDPVDFLLTDLQGRTTGYTSTAGEVTQTPRSYYSGDGRVELVVLPQAATGVYGLQLSGVSTDGGVYRSAATLITESGAAKTITNAGTLSGEVTLALDFRDASQPFPQRSDLVGSLAAQAVAQANQKSNNSGDTLAIAEAAANALAMLQATANQDANADTGSGNNPLSQLMASLSGMGQAVDQVLGGGVGSSLRRLGRSFRLQKAQADDASTNTDDDSESAVDKMLKNLGKAVLGAPGMLLDVLNNLDVEAPPAEGEGTPAPNNAPQQQPNAPEKAAAAPTEKKNAARDDSNGDGVVMTPYGLRERGQPEEKRAWRYGRAKTPTPWDEGVDINEKPWPWDRSAPAGTKNDRPSEQQAARPTEDEDSPQGS